jgi:hypothetical protein
MPTPAITPTLSQVAPPPLPTLSPVRLIGELVARAAIAIALAAREPPTGSSRGANAAGKLIKMLGDLWELMALDFGDFSVLARAAGKDVLLERYGGDRLSEEAIDEMIGWPLQVLARAIAN